MTSMNGMKSLNIRRAAIRNGCTDATVYIRFYGITDYKKRKLVFFFVMLYVANTYAENCDKPVYR